MTKLRIVVDADLAGVGSTSPQRHAFDVVCDALGGRIPYTAISVFPIGMIRGAVRRRVDVTTGEIVDDGPDT